MQNKTSSNKKVDYSNAGRMLKELESLTTINVDWVSEHVTRDDIKLLCRLLKTTDKVKSISIMDCGLSKFDYQLLNGAMRKNSSVTSVTLQKWSIDPNGINSIIGQIDASVESNKSQPIQTTLSK